MAVARANETTLPVCAQRLCQMLKCNSFAAIFAKTKHNDDDDGTECNKKRENKVKNNPRKFTVWILSRARKCGCREFANRPSSRWEYFGERASDSGIITIAMCVHLAVPHDASPSTLRAVNNICQHRNWCRMNAVRCRLVSLSLSSPVSFVKKKFFFFF